jgi:hypothetical protein
VENSKKRKLLIFWLTVEDFRVGSAEAGEEWMRDCAGVPRGYGCTLGKGGAVMAVTNVAGGTADSLRE